MRTHLLICLMVASFVLGAVALATAAEAQGPPAVDVHGWLLTRYYFDQTVNATRDSSGLITNENEDSWLEWERMSLYATARMANGKKAYAEIYIHPWLPNSHPSYLYLESMYFDVPAGPDAFFRIGKGRNLTFGIVPSYGNRKTSNYSPLAETFTMDRALGIQYVQSRGDDSLAFGIFNAQRPGSRLTGMAADGQLDTGALMATTAPHLTDRDSPANRSGQLEVSARIGRQMDDINVGISGRAGAMDNTDSAYLASVFPTYTGNQTRIRYGLDASFRSVPFTGTLQYYAGTTGGIRHGGWEILLGAEPSAQCTGIWRDMSSVCKGLYVRYGQYEIDVPETLNTMTWDTEQLAVSYVLPLQCSFLGNYPKWLQFEYERNTQDAPIIGSVQADEIPNDTFFVELFSAF